MTDKPYDPTKFFDAENAAKAPQAEPRPAPDMTKPEVVAAYIESDIADRIGGLDGDPEKIRSAIDAARDEILARYERQIETKAAIEAERDQERGLDQADDD